MSNQSSENNLTPLWNIHTSEGVWKLFQYGTAYRLVEKLKEGVGRTVEWDGEGLSLPLQVRECAKMHIEEHTA